MLAPSSDDKEGGGKRDANQSKICRLLSISNDRTLFNFCWLLFRPSTARVEESHGKEKLMHDSNFEAEVSGSPVALIPAKLSASAIWNDQEARQVSGSPRLPDSEQNLRII
jgi:hypothetical protein